MKNFLILTTALFFIGLTSCNKGPGEGGTSSITGKLYVVNLNSSGDTIAEYYAMDQDVYIIYGDNDQTYNDKFSTSFDGSYRFDYLTPGSYTLFAYSECDVCPSGQFVVSKTVEIAAKKEEIEVEDIIILD